MLAWLLNVSPSSTWTPVTAWKRKEERTILSVLQGHGQGAGQELTRERGEAKLLPEN